MAPRNYTLAGASLGDGRPGRENTLSSCYTNSVLKNITITVSEEVARWARRKAAEENTSVSRLVGRMLEDQMRLSDEYWRAFERWKKIGAIEGIDAAGRLSREEAHGRR